MAALIHGGGLRVSECCELRIKDLDFDQGLVIVRRGKGDHQADRQSGLAGVWMPDALERREARSTSSTRACP